MASNSLTQILGTVAAVPVGDWNPSTTYQKLNLVRYNCSTYMATQQNQNIEPGITPNWATVWMLTVADGVDALLPQSIATTSTNLVVPSTLTTTPSQFNRIPIQGEFYIQHYVGTGPLQGRSWITNNTVQSVSSTVTVLITQVFETTGATGPQGPQGATGKSLIDKGLWNASTTYLNNAQEQDMVTYNGSTYRVANNQTSVTGIVPTNTTYWTLMASQGVAGNGAGNLLVTNPSGLTAGQQYVLVPSSPLPDGSDGAVSAELQPANLITPVTVTCDHEYEITGYTGDETNRAIPQTCQLTVTKIKGQTRRKSLNLFKVTDEITINSGSEQWVFYYTDTLKSWGLIEGKTYSIIAYNLPDGILCQFIPGYYSLTNFVYTFTFASGMQFRIGNTTVSQQVSFTPQIMLVEGSYTAETIPPYQPFDDTLVNSKVKNILSAGKNLLDLPATFNATAGGITLSLNNGVFKLIGTSNGGAYFEIPLNTPVSKNYPAPLTLSRSKGWQGNFGIGNNTSNFGIQLGWNSVSKTETELLVDSAKLIFDIASGVTTNFEFTAMLNYGSSALPYEPYISDDTFGVDIEITQFGEVDNISKTFNEYGSDSVITLNGSEAWQYETTTAGNGRFYVYQPSQIVGGASGATQNNTASNWIDVTANQTYDGVVGLSYDGTNLQICNPAYTSVSDFQAWLSANPIQFIYRKATPTTQTNVPIAVGYSVTLGGLQQQVIEGDYLPYILTKIYPIDLGAQNLMNILVDRSQQILINANAAAIAALQQQLVATASIQQTTVASFNGSGVGTITSGTLPQTTLFVICVPTSDATTPPFLARLSGTTLYTSSIYNGANVTLYAIS